MSCTKPEDIYAYLEGDLSAEDARRLEAHALSCPACRAAIEDRRRLLRAASLLSPIEVPDDFAARILCRLDESPAPARRRLLFLFAARSACRADGAAVPAPAKRRLTALGGLAAAGIGAAAFFATVSLLALLFGRSLGPFLARLVHGFAQYLQQAVTASVKLLKYVQLFFRIVQDFALAMTAVIKRVTSFISPEIQIACLIAAAAFLVGGILLWRRRSLRMETPHEN
jgi:predicted anti-sigma-YlaC factor YlaD